MKTILMVLLVLVGTTPVALAAPRALVLLVPGTLNSALPGSSPDKPYFSQDVIEGVESAGYAPDVVADLDWFGSFESNGEKVLEELDRAYTPELRKARVPIVLLGHSAGGLDALYAATQVALRKPELPIERILLVSTPLEGVELAEAVFRQPWIGDKLARLCEASPEPINLKSLPEMRPASVRAFLASVRVPARARLYSAAGRQDPPPSIFGALDAEYLSPLFVFTEKVIGKPGDGLVSLESAYGQGVRLLDVDGVKKRVQALPQLEMPLDHAEQSLDARYLRFFERGTGGVREAQRAFYGSLLRKTE